ncbi:MAG: flavodoxin family protein [Bacillota bacterium]
MAKKVTAFIGSPRKLETYQVVQEFEKDLKQYGDIDFEYVFLKDVDLQNCKGCFNCLSKGEEYCPLKDDLSLLLRKMDESDGVIFATPNYSLNVTALMKNFFDRLAFLFHRPRFFRKTSIGIVTQGVYGGKEIVKYLDQVGEWWGFKITRGFFVTTISPRTAAEQEAVLKKTATAAAKFYQKLNTQKTKAPSLFRFFIFRMVRSMYYANPDPKSRDYRYFRDQGWLQSDYYYPVSLGLFRRGFGKIVDWMGREMGVRRRNALLKE